MHPEPHANARGVHLAAGAWGRTPCACTSGMVSTYGVNVQWMFGWQQKQRQHSLVSCFSITPSPSRSRSMVTGMLGAAIIPGAIGCISVDMSGAVMACPPFPYPGAAPAFACWGCPVGYPEFTYPGAIIGAPALGCWGCPVGYPALPYPGAIIGAPAFACWGGGGVRICCAQCGQATTVSHGAAITVAHSAKQPARSR
eukprot:1195701-Prorocentrum_minimum.AAC.5